MASTKFVVQITAADGETPKISTDKLALSNLRAWFHKRLGKNHQGDDTVKLLTAQVAASGTATCAAVQVGDTVSVNGQALTATIHTARGTATCVSVVENDTLTVGAVTFTVKDTPAGALHVETGGTDTEMAENFAAAINANATTSALVKATNAAGVVHIKALATGVGGNDIALAETGSTITVSAATLENGAAVANNQFDFHAQFNDDTATALAAAINASTTAIVNKHVTASAAAAVVTVTAVMPGHAGNAITLASSNGTRLAVSGARLASGTETITSYSY